MKTVAYVGINLKENPGARIHEFGGVITPKNAKALVFEVDGELVFTKKVTIPARAYLRPAFDTKKKEAVKEVGRVLRIIIEKAAKK